MGIVCTYEGLLVCCKGCIEGGGVKLHWCSGC